MANGRWRHLLIELVVAAELQPEPSTANISPPLNYDSRTVIVETRAVTRSSSVDLSLHFPNMNARYLTADVFTDRRFGGNQLAVFPDALEDRSRANATRSLGSSTTPRRPSSCHPATRAIPQRCAFSPRAASYSSRVILRSARRTSSPRSAREVDWRRDPNRLRGRRWTRSRNDSRDGRSPRVRSAVPSPSSRKSGHRRHPRDSRRPPLASPGDMLSGDTSPQAVSCGTPFLFVPLRDRAAVGRATRQARTLGEEGWRLCHEQGVRLRDGS